MEIQIKRIIGVVAIIVDLVLQLAGCVSGVVDLDDDWTHEGKVEASAQYAETVPVEGQVALELMGGNGQIRIVGVAGLEEVRVDAVRRVRSDSRRDAREALSLLRVEVEVSSELISIQTIQPEQTHGRTYQVDYEILVPSYLMISLANGNGSVRLEGIDADAEIANGNGDVTLEWTTGNTWVAMGNGELSSKVQLPIAGRMDYAVGNGTIRLSIQEDVSATFDAEVGNGTINILGLDLREIVSTPRRIHGLLGSGLGIISLAVGNGTIEVHGR